MSLLTNSVFILKPQFVSKTPAELPKCRLKSRRGRWRINVHSINTEARCGRGGWSESLKVLTVLKYISSNTTTLTRTTSIYTQTHARTYTFSTRPIYVNNHRWWRQVNSRLLHCRVSLASCKKNFRKTSSSESLFARTLSVTKHQTYSFFTGLAVWIEAEMNRAPSDCSVKGRCAGASVYEWPLSGSIKYGIRVSLGVVKEGQDKPSLMNYFHCLHKFNAIFFLKEHLVLISSQLTSIIPLSHSHRLVAFIRLYITQFSLSNIVFGR